MTDTDSWRRRGLGVFSFYGKSKGIWLAALVILAAGGCQKIQPPSAHYSPEGERELFKRAPRYPSAKTMQRSDSVAYIAGAALDAEHLSPEQKDVVESLGWPDHIRKPFNSIQGEKVDEWLYMRHNRLFQWIGGHKSFEGEVTDVERTLLEFGYPCHVFSERDEQGIERQTWSYRTEMDMTSKVFSFTNGKVVFRRTAN